MPVYNIKAVARLIGLLPVTLRAWERRYGLPLPHRGDQGYRLYSEYDVRTLRWVKTQMDSGLSISRAVNYLTELRSKGKDPAKPSETSVPPSFQPNRWQANFARHWKSLMMCCRRGIAACLYYLFRGSGVDGNCPAHHG